MKMKMVMAVVPRDESEAILRALISAGHTATFTDSRGGMLRQAQETLFIAVEEQSLQTILDIVQPAGNPTVTDGQMQTTEAFSSQRPQGVPLGGRTVVFVWDIERYDIQADI